MTFVLCFCHYIHILAQHTADTSSTLTSLITYNVLTTYFEIVPFSTLKRKLHYEKYVCILDTTHRTYHRNFRISQLIRWLSIWFFIIMWISTILTSSSPPLNYIIYSHVICISLDLLTTGEFCASVNDFRIDK